MKNRAYHFHDGNSGAAITVRVTPRASHNEVSEVLADGTIKIRLTAPQNEEKLNAALISFLAEILNVKSSQLEIVGGLSGNDKLITIINLDSKAVDERIYQQLKR